MGDVFMRLFFLLLAATAAFAAVPMIAASPSRAADVCAPGQAGGAAVYRCLKRLGVVDNPDKVALCSDYRSKSFHCRATSAELCRLIPGGDPGSDLCWNAEDANDPGRHETAWMPERSMAVQAPFLAALDFLASAPPDLALEWTFDELTARSAARRADPSERAEEMSRSVCGKVAGHSQIDAILAGKVKAGTDPASIRNTYILCGYAQVCVGYAFSAPIALDVLELVRDAFRSPLCQGLPDYVYDIQPFEARPGPHAHHYAAEELDHAIMFAKLLEGRLEGPEGRVELIDHLAAYWLTEPGQTTKPSTRDVFTFGAARDRAEDPTGMMLTHWQIALLNDMLMEHGTTLEEVRAASGR